MSRKRKSSSAFGDDDLEFDDEGASRSKRPRSADDESQDLDDAELKAALAMSLQLQQHQQQPPTIATPTASAGAGAGEFKRQHETKSQLHGFFQRRRPSTSVPAPAIGADAKTAAAAAAAPAPQYCIVHRDCASSGFESKQGFRILVIPKNVLLFRGRSPDEPVYVFPDKARPAYFSDVTVARSYAGKADERCGVFTLARNAQLIDLSDAETVRRLHGTLTGEDRRLFEIVTGFARTRLAYQDSDEDVYTIPESCSYGQKPPTEVRMCTQAFLTLEDFIKQEYASLRLARILCTLGFDGWVIGPTYMRASGARFHAEVMLCNPSQLTIPHPELRCSQYDKVYKGLQAALMTGMMTGTLDDLSTVSFVAPRGSFLMRS